MPLRNRNPPFVYPMPMLNGRGTGLPLSLPLPALICFLVYVYVCRMFPQTPNMLVPECQPAITERSVRPSVLRDMGQSAWEEENGDSE